MGLPWPWDQLSLAVLPWVHGPSSGERRSASADGVPRSSCTKPGSRGAVIPSIPLSWLQGS